MLRHDPDGPELVLSPHFDDAVLSCFGVLAGEREAAVVNVFAGLPAAGARGPWEALAGLEDSRARARARAQEDARALALAGREPLNVQLPEAGARRGTGPPDAGALERALGEVVGSAARVHAPAGIGAHADHLLVRSYALSLRAQGMPVELYAELPYCVMHGWPEWVAGAQAPRGGDVDAYWASYLEGVRGMPALREGRVRRLRDGAAAAKAQAIACYELSLSLAFRTLLSEPGVYGLEVSWELGR